VPAHLSYTYRDPAEGPRPVSDDSLRLVERLRAGDAEAERHFHETYGHLVRRLAVGQLFDAETARDIAQEVLLATIVAIRNGTIRDEGNLGGFVYGTAQNVMHAWQRRRNQEKRLSGQARPSDPPADPVPDPDEEARVEQAIREIRRLSHADQQILHWSLVEGMTSEEIAERLGITPVAARKRKSRALEVLKSRMRRPSRPAPRRH
jgi:RNA polymerase sigma-70 factor (ECF subfamily)